MLITYQGDTEFLPENASDLILQDLNAVYKLDSLIVTYQTNVVCRFQCDSDVFYKLKSASNWLLDMDKKYPSLCSRLELAPTKEEFVVSLLSCLQHNFSD